MRLGNNEAHALKFAVKYPGWHGFNKNDSSTKRAIASLKRKGLVEVNQYHQFRLNRKGQG